MSVRRLALTLFTSALVGGSSTTAAAQSTLYGVIGGPANSKTGGPARLIEIDGTTGALSGVLSAITFGGNGAPVTDLAFDSTTNTLYGVGASGAIGGNGNLVTIDIPTGVATLIGPVAVRGGYTAVGFDGSGRLYATPAGPCGPSSSPW